MDLTTKLDWLGGGAVALLSTASAIGWILARSVKSDSGREVVRNLNARVRSWWGMVAVLAVAFLLGPVVTLVLFAATSFIALREFLSLTPTRASDHLSLFVSFFVIVPVQYVLIGMRWYGLFSIFIPVYVFLLLPALAALAGDTEQFLARCAKVQWALMLTVFCISHAPALLLLEIKDYERQNALLLTYLLTVVQLSDVLQYVFGKLFGKHKLAPKVSPSKTVEGLVGGGLAAIGVGAALWWITPFTPGQAAILSTLTVAAGFLGGFVLSAVKRDLGAKDWGRMIEGHGGVLDRMDSVSFAAPLFFHATRFFFT